MGFENIFDIGKLKTSSQKQKERILAMQRWEESEEQSENALRLTKQ